MTYRPGRKRLSIDIPTPLHNSLFILAKSRNITLTKYVLKALLRYALDETKYDNNNKFFNNYP